MFFFFPVQVSNLNSIKRSEETNIYKYERERAKYKYLSKMALV